MAITNVITQLRTTNLGQSIRFYTEKVGFTLEFEYEDFYAGIRAGQQVFYLKLVDEQDPSIEFVDKGNHFHLYFWTDDVRATADALRRNGGLARAMEAFDLLAEAYQAFNARDIERALAAPRGGLAQRYGGWIRARPRGRAGLLDQAVAPDRPVRRAEALHH